MKQAVVIGATSGIGRSLALKLVAAGWRVGVVGRREALLRELKERYPTAFSYAAVDIAQPAACLNALSDLVKRMGGMHLCVVCAGTGELNPSLDFTLEEPSILTNVRGWTAVVDWAYNYFEGRGGGDLAVVTSIGGLRGSASAPAYNASKAYQINYVEGLCQRSVQSASNVRIMEIRPGLVDTAMAKGSGLFWVMPVDRVANQALNALLKGRRLTVVTRRWLIVGWILRILPQFLYLRL